MPSNFPCLEIQRKNGSEPFMFQGTDAGFDLLGFWQWSVSDLVSNATRGVLAEFIVAQALGIAGGSRNEWDAFDLTSRSGLKIEVKSAAYVQSWYQRNLSPIIFRVGPRRGWDPKTNILEVQSKWQADVYVFALFAIQEKACANPMNLEQWEFYVLPVSTLENRKRSQYSITLRSLQALCPVPVRFIALREKIEGVGATVKNLRTKSATAP